MSRSYIKELLEKKICQTEQKHEARVKMVEDAAEAKILALREEMMMDRAKLETLEWRRRLRPRGVREGRGRPERSPRRRLSLS